MVDEIARLGIAVDSTSAKAAGTALDEFVAAGNRAEASVDAITQASKEQATALQATREWAIKFNREVKERHDRERELARALLEKAAAEKAGATASDAAADKNTKLNKTVDNLGVGTESTARSYGAMISAILRGDMGQAQASLITMASRVGVMPALTSAAGIGFGAMALAVGGASIAAAKFVMDNDKVNQSLEYTGNMAGTSASQIDSIARAYTDGAGGLERYKEGLLAIAQTGNYSQSQLSTVGITIGDMTKGWGLSVRDAVTEFDKLRDEPVKALIELSDKFNFLTDAQRANIQALVENGREAEAVAEAQRLVGIAAGEAADRVSSAAGKMTGAMQAVRDIVNETKNNFSTFVNSIGNSNIDSQIANLERLQRQSASESTLVGRAISTPFFGGEGLFRSTEQLEAQLRVLRRTRDIQSGMQADFAAGQSRENTASQAAVDLAKLKEQFGDREAQRLRRRIELTKTFLDLSEAERKAQGVTTIAGTNGRPASVSGGEFDRLGAEIDKQYADRKAPNTPKSAGEKTAEAQAREYASLERQIDAYTGQLNAAAEADSKLSAVQRFAAATREQLANGTRNLTKEDKAATLAALDELEALDKRATANQERIKQTQQLVELDARLAAVTETATAVAERELATVTMTSRQRETQQRLDTIANQMLRERVALAKQFGDAAVESNDKYMEGLRKIADAESQMVANTYANADKRADAERNWKNGASVAFGEYVQEASNVAKQTDSAFSNAFSNSERAVLGFTETGKFEIKDLAISILRDLSAMATKIALSNILMAVFGSMFGAVQTNYSAGTGIQVGNTVTPIANARGGAYVAGQAVTAFARGGAIVDRPTGFDTGTGFGVAGEAGENGEGIFPLTKDGQGRLGLRASGGGGGNHVEVNTTVNVYSDGSTNSTTSVDGNEQMGRMLGDAISSKTTEEIRKMMQPGGMLWVAGVRGG